MKENTKKTSCNNLAQQTNYSLEKKQNLNVGVQSVQVNTLAASSCNSVTGPTGPTGPTGATGLSAYEVALQNGFVGSEQEWLDSLVGQQGPQVVGESIIPYYVTDGNIDFAIESTLPRYEYGLMVFYAEFEQRSAVGFPQNFTILMDYEISPTFTTSSTTLFTGSAFEAYGEININDGQDYVVKTAIYYSPSKDSNYYLMPGSEAVSGVFVGGQEESVSISNTFNFEVPSKTKIAYAVFLDKIGPLQEDDSANLSFIGWGSISTKILKD